MQHQTALLLGRFGRYEAHARPLDRFTDCLGISSIILLAFDIGLHVEPEGSEHAR